MQPLSPQARVLLLISFLTTFAESMLVPMYAVFTERVGGSILDAGIAFAVFSMATGVAIGLVGTRPWFEKYLPRFLVAGFFLSASCDVSYIFVQNRWQLFGAQLVAGVATGFIEPAWDSLFTDDIEHSSARHWSIWAGGSHIVAGAAALIGGLVVSYFSFNALFLTMAAVDLAAIFVTIKYRVRGTLTAPSGAAS